MSTKRQLDSGTTPKAKLQNTSTNDDESNVGSDVESETDSQSEVYDTSEAEGPDSDDDSDDDADFEPTPDGKGDLSTLMKSYLKDKVTGKNWSCDAVTIVNGVQKDEKGSVEVIIPGKGAKTQISFNYGKTTLGQDKINEMLSSLKHLQGATGSNTKLRGYRRVMNLKEYRIMYGYKKYEIPYFNASKEKGAQPCQKCGIVLPLKLITIDHVRPQNVKNGGGDTHAVAKVFRVFGLTKGQPSGDKTTQLYAHYSIVDRPDNPSAYTEVEPGSKDAKTMADPAYTLNDEGIICYSLIVAAGLLEKLETWSIHSLINCRPLCSSCNSSRSNPAPKGLTVVAPGSHTKPAAAQTSTATGKQTTPQPVQKKN